MLAQYTTPTVTGEGAVSWDKGAHCVIPEVQISGKCVQDGTPTPDAPIEPVFSEGTEVVARGRNLLDVSAVQLGKSLYGSGPGSKFSVSSDANKALFRIDSITEGTAYTLTINNANAKIWRMMVVDDQSFCTYSTYWYSFAKEQGPLVNFTAKKSAETPGKISYIMFVIKKKDETEITYEDVIAAEPRIVLGTYTSDTMPAYEPYFDGGTAVAPQLLAIPGTEYMDTWDPQTGKGIRRIRKIKLSADDDWSRYSYNNGDFYKYAIRTPESYPPLNPTTKKNNAYMCTHLPSVSYEGLNNYSKYGILIDDRKVVVKVDMSTLDEWLQFLQENDVYVWYVLLEPEEFQTDPQPLIQPHGSGSLIQTGGNVDNCPITVKCVTHS